MLQDWEAGLVGNNPGTTARLPRRASPARVVINLVRGRLAPRGTRAELTSAA
jgi:hypothetical protein